MGRLRSTLVILTIALSLAGCGGTAQTVVSPSPSSTEGRATPPEPPTDQATPTDTTPAPQATTEAPVAVAAPYQFSCEWKQERGTPFAENLFTTKLAAAWKLKNIESCIVDMDPSHNPTAAENQVAALYNKLKPEERYTDEQYPSSYIPDESTKKALESLMGICANKDEFVDEEVRWSRKVLAGAVLLCPKAPHAAVMRARASGDLFVDGTYVVGTEVRPGTYRTDMSDSNICSWRRTTGSGRIIAEGYVPFVPRGVTVTIRKSDGSFESDDCGEWKRVP